MPQVGKSAKVDTFLIGANLFPMISSSTLSILSTSKLTLFSETKRSASKMMNIERRHGEDKPVIKKALVELDGAPFKYFEAHRDEWAKDTCFVYPGAIQYYGPAEVCDITTVTLALEHQK